MSEIVLATLNARYVHCSFGLRYLMANMGDLRQKTALLEFTIQQPTLEILDAILEQQPTIVGLGVYIWNVDETSRLIADLKQVRPELIVVVGGPEVSYGPDDRPITQLADRTFSGEADLEFAQFCRQVLENRAGDPVIGNPSTGVLATLPISHVSPLPDLNRLVLPYELYNDEDVAHRVIYVEASRGCPFTCEFCLSALDIPVRQFPLDQFLAAMDSLLHRGVRQFKFVDRTFNLNLRVSRAILQFFLEHYEPGLFLHFEMIPDRLPESLKELIVRFPAGALQFEVGIQTFNDEVCERISRTQDHEVVEANLSWLREETGVHVHADLIVGLPGETLESFAAGFDRLVRLGPQEIQVGILKRLRGTPIVRHDDEWRMVYSPHPPYEILSTKTMSFQTIQELRRFAKYWDTIANSGNFVDTLALIWNQPFIPGADELNEEWPCFAFEKFRRLATWLFGRERRTHGIPLGRLVERLFAYLTEVCCVPASTVAAVLWKDYQRGGRSDKPACLRDFLDPSSSTPDLQAVARSGPKRQSRHWGTP